LIIAQVVQDWPVAVYSGVPYGAVGSGPPAMAAFPDLRPRNFFAAWAGVIAKLQVKPDTKKGAIP
jgi:hypothetical protein